MPPPGRAVGALTATDYKGEAARLRLQVDVLARGARVVVVDDWLETSSQFHTAQVLLEGAGGTIVGASVIVNQLPSTPPTELTPLPHQRSGPRNHASAAG